MSNEKNKQLYISRLPSSILSYRNCVGIVIINAKNKVLLCKREGRESWQYPQGGIMCAERPVDTMYRELYEETGISKKDVQIVQSLDEWLYYDIPLKFCYQGNVVGQKQKWFLVRLLATDEAIKIPHTLSAEFDAWRWGTMVEAEKLTVEFKRPVYKTLRKHFS